MNYLKGVLTMIDLNLLTFNEDDHTYTYRGKQLPNVSAILRPIADFSRVDPAVLAQAAERGTRVHEACLDWDFDHNTEVDPDIEGYVRAYASFIRDYRVKDWLFYEKPVTDGFIAGTLDRFGVIGGWTTMLDIKSGQFHSMQHYAQVNAYTKLLRSCMPEFAGVDIHMMVLCIKNDGTYVVHEPSIRENENALRVYNACLDLHEAVQCYKEGRKVNGK